MRPYQNASGFCHAHRFAHNHWISSMESAGDIGRTYKIKHCGIIANNVGAVAFAHVAIKI
jgi:hypothetical protein